MAAINANLDEDVPRLMFADWLQENGDEARAEFIRIQCELYRVHPNWENRALHERYFSDRHRALYERQNRLRSENFNRWVGSLPEWTRSTTWAFRRGFCHFFAASALQWLAEGEHIRRQTATEQLARSSTNPRTKTPWGALFGSAATTGLKELLLPDLDSEGAKLLAGSAVLCSLRELSVGKLGKWRIDAEAARQLVSSPRLAGLRALRVTSNYVGDAVASALVNAHVVELDALELVCAGISSASFQSLLPAPVVRRLRCLNVQAGALGDSDVAALAASPLAGLEELNLRYTGLTAKAAHSLASWPGLRGVRVLHLAGTRLGEAGVRELLASNHLTAVDELELPERDIGRRAQREIEALPEFARIRYATFAS